jgi:SAM-dependent methyltransferase
MALRYPHVFPLQFFIRINKRIAHAIEGLLPQRRVDLQQYYDETVARYASALPEGALIADVGCGRTTTFARLVQPGRVQIVGVDELADALEANEDINEGRVADVNRGLPFRREEVDLMASRSVLEHLENTSKFIDDSLLVLKPGGHVVHIFASKFGPFALANAILPHRVSARLLRLFHPECQGAVGFRTYYDRTYASGIRRLLNSKGFEIVDLRVSYYQSGYYNFFLPLYLFSALYELVIYSLGWEDMAAKVMVVARRPPIRDRAAP